MSGNLVSEEIELLEIKSDDDDDKKGKKSVKIKTNRTDVELIFKGFLVFGVLMIFVVLSIPIVKSLSDMSINSYQMFTNSIFLICMLLILIMFVFHSFYKRNRSNEQICIIIVLFLLFTFHVLMVVNNLLIFFYDLNFLAFNFNCGGIFLIVSKIFIINRLKKQRIDLKIAEDIERKYAHGLANMVLCALLGTVFQLFFYDFGFFLMSLGFSMLFVAIYLHRDLIKIAVNDIKNGSETRLFGYN